MKTRSIVVFLMLLFLWHDISSANGEQVAWRWRNDNGNVYSATWKGPVNTPVVLTQYENVRLRILDRVGSANSSTISLRYTEDLFNVSWTPITRVDTGKFFISPSQYLTDTMSYFDNQLFPPIYFNHWYRRTITFDSSISYLLVADTNSLYELEYSLKPTARIPPGSAYFFSLFTDTTLMHSWDPWEFAVLLTPPVNWRILSLQFAGLSDVCFVDANNGTAVGGGILRTTNGGKTWTCQSRNEPPDAPALESVDFADPNVGVAVGGSTITRTTNGGQIWSPVAHPYRWSYGTYFHGVHLSDRETGTIVGGVPTSGGYPWHGVVLRTTDGGVSWFEQLCPVVGVLNAVCFTSSNEGTAVGQYGTILRTTNGGQSWFRQSCETTPFLSDVCFMDGHNGIIVGKRSEPPDEEEGWILKTSDGGSTWERVMQNARVPPLHSVHFTDSRTGWAAGDYGWILKTTDGGSTWKKLTSGTYRDLRSIYFVDGNTGWAVGGETVLATTNGGVTSLDHEKVDAMPTRFALEQNYPNPFNPTTAVSFQLPVASDVRLVVYDVLGREVKTLVDERTNAGPHQVTFNGTGLSSGIYICRMSAGTHRQAVKMVLTR